LGFAKSEGDPRVLGLSREGFEEQFMALLIAIEASCIQNNSTSNFNQVSRGNMGLKD
jgi:hypothetical protein